MFCVSCGHDGTAVISTKGHVDHVSRRRECPKCLTRFNTREHASADLPRLDTWRAEVERKMRPTNAPGVSFNSLPIPEGGKPKPRKIDTKPLTAEQVAAAEHKTLNDPAKRAREVLDARAQKEEDWFA